MAWGTTGVWYNALSLERNRKFSQGTCVTLITHAVIVAVGGAIGTLGRAGFAALASVWLGSGFPWSTLAVNVIGSFVFGAIVGWSRGQGAIHPAIEPALLIGLLGGFTTYSSYAFQSVEILEGGRPFVALAYIIATNVAALMAVWAGLRVGGITITT